MQPVEGHCNNSSERVVTHMNHPGLGQHAERQVAGIYRLKNTLTGLFPTGAEIPGQSVRQYQIRGLETFIQTLAAVRLLSTSTTTIKPQSIRNTKVAPWR